MRDWGDAFVLVGASALIVIGGALLGTAWHIWHHTAPPRERQD